MEYEYLKHLEQEQAMNAPTPLSDAAKKTYFWNEVQHEFVDYSVAVHLERRLAAIYELVEGSADGTVDATDYEHLCNRIVGIIKP